MVKAAAIFVPPDLEDDVAFARQGLDYLMGREYEYAGHYRDPDLVDHVLMMGFATVVILICPAHAIEGRAWPVEFVGPDRQTPPSTPVARRHNGGRVWVSLLAITQDQPGNAPSVPEPRGERTVRNVRSIHDEGDTVHLPSAGYVREVIFGDGPAPTGLDGEMIAAARRIARRLGGN